MESVKNKNRETCTLRDIEMFLELDPVHVPVSEFLFDSNYTSLKSDEQRVSYIMDVWKEKNFRSYSAGEFGKSLTKSRELRLKGNEAFKKKDYMSAIALYTRSVSYAPHPYTPFINNEQSADNAGSEDCYIALALSVANRSAALFEMKKYEACLKDISYALSMNYPADLSQKLHLRRAKCLHALGIKHDINMLQTELENLSLTNKYSEDKKLSLKTKLENLATDSFEFLKNAAKERDESYPDVKISYSENNTLPHYSSCVELRNTEDMGRGIFATRNIEIGDVILVEKPFSWSLYEDSFYTHCHFCCKPCRSLIPCWHCSLAMFCSEECLKNCWEKFHDLDCSLLLVLSQTKFLQPEIRALRTVIIASKMFRSISDFCKTGKLFMKNNGSNLYANKECHSEYLCVYNLVTNTEFRPHYSILLCCLFGVIISKLLAERTNFFLQNTECGQQNDMAVDEMRCIIGYLLTRHLHNLSHGLQSYKMGLKVGGFTPMHFLSIGSAIYPQASLLNHSCDPNVFNYRHLGNHIVVRAWRSIRRGEQLFDCYGPLHSEISRPERQSYYLNNYFFKCRCIACEEDWPTLDKLKYNKQILKCNFCGNVLPDDVKQRVIICTKCHKGNDCQKIGMKLDEVEYLVSASNGKDVLQVFCNMKKILENLNLCVCRPFYTLITSETCFRIYFVKLSTCNLND